MSVSAVDIKDAANVTRAIAARLTLSAYYPMADPEVLIARIVATGTSGDATGVVTGACVLRAVRLWNGGGVPCHAKIHNVAGTPVVGVAGVVYSASAQAGMNNPDQLISGGGLALATGLGFTLTTGAADASTTGVAAGSAILEVEYHLA